MNDPRETPWTRARPIAAVAAALAIAASAAVVARELAGDPRLEGLVASARAYRPPSPAPIVEDFHSVCSRRARTWRVEGSLRVTALAVAPDGSRLLARVGCTIHAIALDGADSVPRPLWSTREWGSPLLFLADGRRVVDASVPGRAVLLHGPDDADRILGAPGKEKTYGVAVSLDGSRVVVGKNRSAVVLDVATGRALATLHVLGNRVEAVQSLDGERVATATRSGWLELWDAHGERVAAGLFERALGFKFAARRPVGVVVASDRLEVLALDPKPEELLAGREGPVARLQGSRSLDFDMPARPGETPRIALSPDGRLAAVALGHRVGVFDLEAQAALDDIDFTRLGEDPVAVTFDPTAPAFYVSTTEQRIHRFEIALPR